jgi:signal peptidase I
LLKKKAQVSTKGKNSRKIKKSKPREFFDALLWAAIVAFIIKVFLFEAYRIPTGSMENTLLVGDFLLVTKFTYGATTPRNIPFTDVRLPYFKLPGFKDPELGDIIVFDFPGNRDEFMSPEVLNYIKRCVGLPGDTLQIINQVLYNNGKIFPNPPKLKFLQTPKPEGAVEPRTFPKGFGWNEDNYGPLVVPKIDDKIKIDFSNFDGWKLFVEREGHTIRMTPNSKVLVDDKELVNGEYTVERDYLFMMGDNRTNSLDSRFWGFMPMENVVGEAFMLYWSWNSDIPLSHFIDLLESIRWGRIGKIID